MKSVWKSDDAKGKTMKHSSFLAAGGALLVAIAVSSAAPRPKVSTVKVAAKPAPAKPAALKPMPRYVSMQTLKILRDLRGDQMTPGPSLIAPSAPVLPEMQNGFAEIAMPAGKGEPLRIAQTPRRRTPRRTTRPAPRSTRIAPSFPRPVAPAAIVRPAAVARPAVPRWVRFPLESQLCGISLGSKVLDKDKYNRIDRYGLFAMHGNPTAIVISGGTTVTQTPPEAATIFPTAQNAELPSWAAAITVSVDANHVEWLYNRGTYAMGFVVDRFGLVDAIVCAGLESSNARTQFEDPIHTVKLGDDLRKVLFRYGYPDTMETYGVAVAANGQNSAYQTFEVRYEQSYNVVFSLRQNRVVRIYIFGDPDFFNPKRRQNLLTKY